MMLQALHRLYFRLRDDPAYAIPRQGYSLQKISFVVVLSPAGKLQSIIDARYASSGVERQMQLPGAGKPPGRGIHPGFLWDTAAYIFGLGGAAPDMTRADAAFYAFRRRHLAWQKQIHSFRFAALCRFLESWRPAEATLYPEVAATPPGFGIFLLQGDELYIHDDPVIRQWWDQWWERSRRENATAAAVVGQCLLTGQSAPIARIQPTIKGVCGGQTQVTLVSCNDSAYESFGKEQGFNAPVGTEAARTYAAALNALLDGPMRYRHRTIITDMTLAFWSERRCLLEDIFIRFITTGSTGYANCANSPDWCATCIADADDTQESEATLRAKMRRWLDCLLSESERPASESSGEIATGADQISVWILGITPNAARAAMRLFIQTSVGALTRHLRRHYQDIGIERQFAPGATVAEAEFPPLTQLVNPGARAPENASALFVAPYLEAVFTGAPYPAGMYAAVLRRLRREREITYASAAVIKGYLIRNYREDVTVSLDCSRCDPAYRLGRLFAALEKTRGDALGKTGISLRHIFYGTASASPRSVFPGLLRSYPWHLERLREPRRQEREELVEEIMEPLTGFAEHLDLREQGLFAIGYYHQMQALHQATRATVGVEPVRQAS